MDHTRASDLERRKKVRIRLRGDLAIAPQKYEGKTYYVVKDPVSLRYYRFKEQEHFLIDYMDGTHTLDEAQKEFEKRFRPERLTLEDLESFAQQLLTAGLAQNESPQAGKQLFDRRKKRRRSEWMQTLTNILYIKIPLYDPDRLLTGMVQYLGWMFTPLFGWLSAAFLLGVLLFVGIHFETFWEKLPDYHQFFTFKAVAYLWIALGVVKVIHEFGHGLSCKAFGGEVHEMGALFLVFSPCLYCNVSDAWTLPSKWKRIIISGAGIYVELMIAAAATIVWWNTPGQPFINNLSMSLMVVCSVSTVVFNANPLMRYDGYYVLADWMEIPNLRDRSNRFLKNTFLEHCLGVEVQPEPYMALWRKTLFISYAIVSYVYRWFVTFRILIWMDTFLKPYKLDVISHMLMAAAAGSMVGWPLYRLSKNLYKRGRLPDMKPIRVVLTSSAFAAVILFIFLVPLPIFSRVRQTALIQVHPDATSRVFLPEPAVLRQLLVRDGDAVHKDQPLAEFTSRELETQLIEAKAQFYIRSEELKALDKQKAEIFDAAERSKLEVRIAEAATAKSRHEKEIEHFEARKQRLVLLAPADGVVMGPPLVDHVGRLWEEKDLATPVFTIGDPERLRAWLPVSPDEYNLLSEDMKKTDDLEVTLRVQGLAERTWKGKLAPLPESEAAEIPLPLTNKAGGPIAVKPSSQPGHYVPQSQQYLVFVDIQDPHGAIAPGAMAQVKVHSRPRTIAWWIWRKFSDTFDLKLNFWF